MGNWRLLGFSAVVGMGFALSSVLFEASPLPSPGRAELIQPLPTSYGTAWQIVFDPVALGLSKTSSMSWLDDGAQLATTYQKVFGSELTPELRLGAGSQLIRVVGSDSVERPLGSLQPANRPKAENPLFHGTPVVAGEWTDRTHAVRFHLYHANAFQTSLLVGPIQGRWDLQGFTPSGLGFPLSHVTRPPENVTQLVSVDSQALKVPQAQAAAMKEALKRWELPDVDWALQHLGPALTYLKWQDSSYFVLGVRDRPAMEALIAKRFPTTVVPTTTQRAEGVKIQGFQSDEGPAWAFRGDHLFASRHGGTDQLAEYLRATIGEKSKSTSSLWSELERLAPTQQGWHLLILQAKTNQGLPWAALIRWSSPSELTGYLVVQLEP